MPSLRKSHLPHRVDIRPFLGETSDGEKWGEWITGVPAYVEAKSVLVTDRRRDSVSEGQQVASSTFIVLLKSQPLAPRDIVRIGQGTPLEREAETITAAYFEYKRAPAHYEGHLE